MLELCSKHGGEQPCPDDVLALAAQVVGENEVEEFRVASPTASQLRGQTAGGPGVHDVELANEATGNAALVWAVSRRGVSRGVNG